MTCVSLAPNEGRATVKASNLALVVALTTGIAANWHTIVTIFGSWVILTAIIVTVLGLGLGALLGGSSPETRATTTLVSGMRFASRGLIIIGTQLNEAPNYIGPAITFALVSLILPMLLAAEVGRKSKTDPGVESTGAHSRTWQRTPMEGTRDLPHSHLVRDAYRLTQPVHHKFAQNCPGGAVQKSGEVHGPAPCRPL